MAEWSERNCGHSRDKYPVFLGEQGTEQFTVRTFANWKLIREVKVHDPFIRTTVGLRGIMWAIRALLWGVEIEVKVDGSEGVQRAVMTLDPYQLQKETEEIMEQRRISRESNGVLGSHCYVGEKSA